jgi:hypothetical protein
MALVTKDIEIEQGATFTLSFIWKDSNGTPVNLTGYQARMQIRKSVNAPDPPALSLTHTNGIALGGAAGTINVTATASQTSSLTLRTGVYDLELESASGTVTRFAEGVVTNSFEVTR